MNNKSQIFSADISVAVIVFLFILITSAWFWDSTKEKMHLSETRNDLELVSRNAIAVLINTVGDPPNWHNVSFSEENVYSIGIGKNRAWMLDREKIKRLDELNDTEYDTIKKILGIRGPGYELYMNISEYNGSFNDLAVIGKFPNATAVQVVNIHRIALTDQNEDWLKLRMLVWRECFGAEC